MLPSSEASPLPPPFLPLKKVVLTCCSYLYFFLGDTDRYNTKLPNKVYNKLRVHAVSEAKRAARLHEKKDQSTATQAVDQRTRLLLFKMLNEGLLTEVHGVISVGM